jgi:hypothetical protein
MTLDRPLSRRARVWLLTLVIAGVVIALYRTAAEWAQLARFLFLLIGA